MLSNCGGVWCSVCTLKREKNLEHASLDTQHGRLSTFRPLATDRHWNWEDQDRPLLPEIVHDFRAELQARRASKSSSSDNHDSHHGPGPAQPKQQEIAES